jgi:hypothetical protein
MHVALLFLRDLSDVPPVSGWPSSRWENLHLSPKRHDIDAANSLQGSLPSASFFVLPLDFFFSYKTDGVSSSSSSSLPTAAAGSPWSSSSSSSSSSLSSLSSLARVRLCLTSGTASSLACAAPAPSSSSLCPDDGAACFSFFCFLLFFFFSVGSVATASGASHTTSSPGAGPIDSLLMSTFVFFFSAMFTFDELLLFLPSIAPRFVRASAPGDTTVLSAQVASLVDCLTYPTSLVMDALPARLPACITI